MKIHIDASKCISSVGGSAEVNGFYDAWRYKNLDFESGKIYGLISEYGQGNMYVSYLLGGKVDFNDLVVTIDNAQITRDKLEELSWNLEPSNEKYKNELVKKSIEKAIKSNGNENKFDDIAREFYLTEARYDRKLRALSGERWRATAALGYALNKKIFYAPYMCSNFYYQMSHSNLFKVLRYLADKDKIVLLPSGSDTFLKQVVDECIYIDSETMKDWICPVDGDNR